MSDNSSDNSSNLPDNLPDESRNAVKDPSEWTTGDEPMTGPQASYLRTLLQQSGKSEHDLEPGMTKAAASEMIDQLQRETGRGTPDADRSGSGSK